VHDTRRTRIVLGVLLAAALALITINYRGGTGSRVGGLRGLGGSVFGSVESAASFVTRPVAAFTDGLTGSSSQGKINALQRQVVDLRAQLNQQRLSKYDEGQLSQLLQLAGRGRYRIVTASVIAAGASYDDSVTIDAGRMDGIKPDETVLNGQGLVGTVTSASATTATVLLATDASVTVGVRLAGTGQIGVVSGTGKSMTGDGLLRLQVFDVNAILHQGQELVTFGSAGGRPYVPGVPVGVITKLEGTSSSLTKEALVRPFADDTALGVVGVVVVPPRTDPRFSVLPPRPTPSPSASATASPGRHGASPGATASPGTTGSPGTTPSPGATGPGG
jgi:rod shape-determining protein MreC